MKKALTIFVFTLGCSSLPKSGVTRSLSAVSPAERQMAIDEAQPIFSLTPDQLSVSPEVLYLSDETIPLRNPGYLEKRPSRRHGIFKVAEYWRAPIAKSDLSKIRWIVIDQKLIPAAQLLEKTVAFGLDNPDTLGVMDGLIELEHNNRIVLPVSLDGKYYRSSLENGNVKAPFLLNFSSLCKENLPDKNSLSRALFIWLGRNGPDIEFAVPITCN
jgi:hypothetical protein